MPRDSDPLSSLTVGQLKYLIEDLTGHGAEADAAVIDTRIALRDLGERLEDLIEFVAELWGEADHEDADARLDRYATAYLEHREPDGTPPTQVYLAEQLGVTDRNVRLVGWHRIIQRAEELDRK